jgi:hypothetical protein
MRPIMGSVKTELQSAIQQLSEEESTLTLEYVRSLRAKEAEGILKRFANRRRFVLPKPEPRDRLRREPVRPQGKPVSQILIENRR